MKTTNSKTVISIVALFVFLLLLVSCSEPDISNSHADFEQFPFIINNADRTLGPMEMSVGERFYNMELLFIFYEADFDSGVQMPEQAHFEGRMTIRGMVETSKETGDHYLIIDEEFLERIPTFNIERTRPYMFRIFDLVEAIGMLNFVEFGAELAADPQFISGRQAVFQITGIVSHIYLDEHDVIFGTMRLEN